VKFHVLIPAAGSGSRMGSDTPKQYLSLLGLPLIAHTVAVFSRNPRISSINIVLSAADTYWEQQHIALTEKSHIHRCGGETRAATVLNGLSAIRNQLQDDDWVLVHDADRPGMTENLLNTLLDDLQNDTVGGLLAI